MSYKEIPALDKLSINDRLKAIWDALTGSSSGGSSAPTAVTYSQLMTKIGAGTLVAGSQYLITDYATKHYIVDASEVQYLDAIITGATEGLIVTAISTNKVSHEAKSILYPQDIIHYDPNPANWLQDISFADFTDSANPVIVTGFKGVIYFRHDTLLDNYMGYDFRNCKFRRWKTDCTAWDGVTAFVAGNFVNHSGFIYKALQNSTNQEPADGSAYWMKLLDLSLTEYWNNKSDATNGITSDVVFADFKTFEGTDINYQHGCKANHFKPFKDNYAGSDISRTILGNNVFFLQDSIYPQIYSNELKENYGNTVGSNFYYNNVGNYFSNNTINSNFFANTIGNYFYNNLVGDNFNSNTIGSYFYSNSIGIGFQVNNAEDQSCVSFGDFTNTKLYGALNCTLFKREDGTTRLRYYDGSDVLQIATP